MISKIENDNHAVRINNNGLEFIQFSNFLKHSNVLKHCFTSRLGGISIDECYSMNLGFNRNDKRQNVLENYKRISGALEIDYRNMVFSNQVHDNRIKEVNENDIGKGIIRASDIIGFDGLVTNKKQVALVTFYADCVPVFFFDPVKNVIGLTHSGWRGTVKCIAGEMVKKFEDIYGCNRENIETAIGPSIGACCFEVGEEVYKEFADKLEYSKKFCEKKDNNKWHISLQSIIKKTLVNSGIKENKICMSEICTKCNNDLFFSHRGDNGRTGSLAAIMQMI